MLKRLAIVLALVGIATTHAMGLLFSGYYKPPAGVTVWVEPNNPNGPLSDFDSVFAVPNTQWPTSAAGARYMILQVAILRSKGATWVTNTAVPFLTAQGMTPILDSGAATGASCEVGGTVTASITSNVMTVTAVTDGAMIVGQTLWIAAVSTGRTITSFGTGTGGTGTYNVSAGSDVASTTISAFGDPSTSSVNTTALSNDVALITQLQSGGGTVEFVSIQSLYSKMSGNNVCAGYYLDQRNVDAIWYIHGIRASFPNVKIIINDATLAKATGNTWINTHYPNSCGGSNCDDIRTMWTYILAALTAATPSARPDAYSGDQAFENYREPWNPTFVDGSCIPPLQADADVACLITLADTYNWLNWMLLVQGIRPMLEITSLSATTNAQWKSNVLALTNGIGGLGTRMLARDYIVISFRCATNPCASNPIPDITLPEGTAGTFTNSLLAVETALTGYYP